VLNTVSNRRCYVISHLDTLRAPNWRRATLVGISTADTARCSANSCGHSIDVYGACDNLVEVLGRLADLAPAHAAFEAAVAKYPEKRICIRERGRIRHASSGS